MRKTLVTNLPQSVIQHAGRMMIMKNQLRRRFLQKSVGASLASFATLTLTGMTKRSEASFLEAQDPPVDSVTFTTAIARNHGHEISFTIGQTLILFQQSRGEVPITLGIQGRSGHNHNLTLTFENIVTLLSTSELVLTSSTDSGHNHEVRVTMTIAPPQPELN